MNFAITGTDARFVCLRTLLEAEGHRIVPPGQADVTVPPPWEPGAAYARSESYLVANAGLTAEGAAVLLAEEMTLAGAEVLVLGFGRVGKLCAMTLRSAGAHVTVAARSAAQRSWAGAMGFHALDTGELSGALGGFAAAVNTVPALLLDEKRLAELPEGCVLLELASVPGGIDAAAARERSLRYIRAPGLPGTYAPERAAAILRNALFETLERPKPRLGVAMTGSHCCLDETLTAFAGLLTDFELVPILSDTAGGTDTRFGPAAGFRRRLETLCGRVAIDSIAEAEPLGGNLRLDALLVAPCTGNTLGKLAGGITDGTVTMACKAHLRNGRPLVLAVSTNDGLSGSAGSIAALLQRKNVYFVPFGQDDPHGKPCSLRADFGRMGAAVKAAMEHRQLQPVLTEF